MLEAISGAQNPYDLADHDVVYKETIPGIARLLDERVDTSDLRRVIMKDVSQENVGVDSDHRFLA